MSTPMKYPTVAWASSLSTPTGVNGPGPAVPLLMSRKAVTTIAPGAGIRLALRTTYTVTRLKAPEFEIMLQPM
jgi:hypothetical protein